MGIITWYDGAKKEFGKELHRLNGPAIIYSNGTKIWYFHGVIHRLDGPAIEHSNGDLSWIFEGRYHRLDGPAFIRSDGSVEWWFEGNKILVTDLKEFKESLNFITVGQVLNS